jgi:cytochrome c peroxidase
MRKQKYALFAVLTASVLLAVGYSTRATAADQIDLAALKTFAPLPDVVPGGSGAPTEEQISLGRMLYFDPRISKSQTISCNSCHPLAKYGVDGQATSEGYQGQHGDRNAPSVYNAAGHFAQFWDGRAADVEEQAKGPVRNPVEMAMSSEQEVAALLRSMPEYVQAFQRAFPKDPEPVCLDNMGIAIGAFERKLLTPGRWDKFLQGDQAALAAREKSGLREFLSAGCQGCHSGSFLGGASFQKLGVAKPYPDSSDPGRYKVTQSEADRMFFKVPSLRNVAMTGPYFHDGKVTSLREAVARMAEYQRGRALSERQVEKIVTWLGALTGDIPVDYIKEPPLPKSTSTTPKPETGD